jgi:type IV pilus assembly protein PilM
MSFLGNLFTKKAVSVLGVDIGSSAIKIVQIRRQSGQAVLETYGELSLGPYAQGVVGQSVQLTPERIAMALSDLMKEKEVNVTTKSCGVSIPFGASLMTELSMPAVAEKQLGVMVPIEARKYIPVPISEVMLDWSIIPTDEKHSDDLSPIPAAAPAKAPNIPQLHILVVAITNDTIAKFQTIVGNANLDASFFEIELFSTIRAVVDEPLRPVMILDIGASSSKIYIVERGVVKASHTVNRGSQDITHAIAGNLGLSLQDAEIMKREQGLNGTDPKLTSAITSTLDYVFSEANRTLLDFEKKYNRTVAKVFLVGGGAALRGLPELAKSNFKTDTVAGNPFAKLATPAFLEQILKQTGPEFAVAIGLALRKLSEVE